MEIINQSHEILSLPENCLQTLEKAGRTCYKSESRITEDSAEKFVEMLVRHRHHAMIEFGDIIVKFITNRGVTHELVRHRHCSFAQESTRYVKYDKQMQFIKPDWCSDQLLGKWEDPVGAKIPGNVPGAEKAWMESMARAQAEYAHLLSSGWKAQQAREVLPNSLKTEIVMKANIREWRHIFTLRCAKASHPQMVALMRPLLEDMKKKLPVVFDDLNF